jgi:hypothetical protein
MRRLFQTVSQGAIHDLFRLLERATVPHASDLERGAQGRFLPPGFVALAFAGLLLIAAAGVQEGVREGVPSPFRPRTNLRSIRIAYASWNRMGGP